MSVRDRLKEKDRQTREASRRAAARNNQAARSNQTSTKNNTKSTDTSRNQQASVRNTARRSAQRTASQASQGAARRQRTGQASSAVRSTAQQAVKKVGQTKQGSEYNKANQAGLQYLDRERFKDDMKARKEVTQENIGRGRYVPQKSSGILPKLGMEKYSEPGLKENNPNTPKGKFKTVLTEPELDRMAQFGDLEAKKYGLGNEKVPVGDVIRASNLDPLSALKADSRSYAYFGRGKGVTSKQPEQTDKERVQSGYNALKQRVRKQGAEQQTVSPFDNRLEQQFRDEIKLAKEDYDAADARYKAAKTKDDQMGMVQAAKAKQNAHQRAETWRRIKGGYSGGIAGDEYITPELSAEDKANLNKEGQALLRAAKIGYEHSRTNTDRAKYAAQGQAIRQNPLYQKEQDDRGAYRDTDAEGRMRYAGTKAERQEEKEQAAAIPKAIGYETAGAFASIPEVTRQALQADAARNQDLLRRVSEARGGGDVNLSEPETPTEEMIGQRFLRRGQEYREKATEGQRGLEKYLTEALITGGEMIPGLAATALTGGAAAPGLAVMGAQAAGQKMGDLYGQGVDPVEAFNRGLLSGAIEAGTELIPLKNLLKTAKGGGKSFAKNLAAQALEEAGTEEASELLGYAADKAYKDPNASLTVQDLKDTAAISLLTSLGMGAGAGLIGSRRRTPQARQQAQKTTAAMDQVTPGVDELAQAEAAIQQRVQALNAKEQEALALLSRNSDNPMYFKHFQERLNLLRQERGQLQNDMIGLEMQKAQRNQVEQEKAAQAQEQIKHTKEAQKAAQEAQQGQVGQKPQTTQNTQQPVIEQPQQERSSENRAPQTVVGKFKAMLEAPVINKESIEKEFSRIIANVNSPKEADLLQRIWDAWNEKRYANWKYDYAEGTAISSALEQLNQAETEYKKIALAIDAFEQQTAEASQEAAEAPQAAPTAEQVTEPTEAQESVQAQETARKTGAQYGQPENHIDNRESGNLGSQKVKAFQWDHPEIKPFFKQAAEALKADAEYSDATRQNVRASKIDQARGKKAGTVMQRNDALRKLHDMGLSTQDIIKACDAIIHDEGQENNAAAKRVELALDQMLSKGYDPLEGGGHPDYHVGPNAEYLKAKGRIGGGTEPGSWEAYRKSHENLMDWGEVTEEELRQEWEERQNEPISTQPVEQEIPQEKQEPEVEPVSEPTIEETVAELKARAEDIQAREARAQTEEDREQINREKAQWRQDYEAAKERYSVGAAPGGFDPFSRMANEYGTIEPGENPARMVDVPQSTNGQDRVRRFVRTAMEAEVTSEEAVKALENEVVKGTFSYNRRKDADAVAVALNTIESIGYDGAMEQWNDVVEGRRLAGKDDIVLAQMLYSLAAQNNDIDTVRKLAAEIAAEGTVSGQKIQALRLLKKATPEGKLYYIRKVMNQLQTDLEKSRGDKAPDLEIDPELEEALLDAETEEEQQQTLDDIYDDIARQIPPTFADRLNAWRYFAMLGNPRTHIRNIVGNLVVQMPLQVSNKASALVQAATLPKGKRTRSVTVSRAAKQFARKNYQEMKDVLSGDKYLSELGEIRRRQKLFPTPLQKTMDANSKALEAEDMLFKKGTYIRSLAEFITARGWDPETMTGDQLEEAMTHAIKDAKHATFQDESALASAIAKLENKNKGTKIAIGGLVPFKGVPINIAKMGFELSPAGLAKAITYDAKQVKAGNMDAADMIDHLTRGMSGTSIALLGYFLASSGLLTAGAGDNDKENAFEMAQGSQEYAVDLGDHTYTIDWASPSAIPLFLGAEFFNARQKWGEESDDEGKKFKDGLEALTRLFDPMLNMTVLSGVSNTLNTISYSKMNPLFPLGWGMVQNYAGQFVPTLSGQIARTMDDTRRTTYTDRNSPVPNSLQRFIQKQENKIPGLSKKNLPYLDAWGREDREENPFLRAFENFLSPGYIAKKNTTEVDAELTRLNDAGFDSVLPVKAKASTKINDQYLSAVDYETLVKTQGQTAMDMLSNAVESSAYQNMTDADKAAYVQKIFDYAKTKGKQAAGEDPGKAASWIAKLDTAAEEHDVGVSALLNARMQVESIGDADGNGSIKTEEAWNAIHELNLPDNENRALFDLYNGTKQSYDEYVETAKKKQEKAEKEAAATEKANEKLGSSATVDLDTFSTAVNAVGGYNQMSYTEFFDTMDKLNIPEAERPTYYDVVQSYKAHPWKKDYAGAKKYKKR